MAAAPSGDPVGTTTADAVANPYTIPRLNHLRYTGAILIDGPSMYKSLFTALLPDETNKDWNDGQLWNSWCEENYDAIETFKFFSKLKSQGKTELIGPKPIPIFENVDVSFFAHVIDKKVKRNHVKSASDLLRVKRNAISHDAGSGIDDEECYELFESLKNDVVKKMFKDFSRLKIQWLNHFDQVRMGELDAGRLEKVEQNYKKLREKVAKAQFDARQLRKMLERSQIQADMIIYGLDEDFSDDDQSPPSTSLQQQRPLQNEMLIKSQPQHQHNKLPQLSLRLLPPKQPLPQLHSQSDPQPLPKFHEEPKLPLRPLPQPQPPLQPLLHTQPYPQPLPHSPEEPQLSLQPLPPPQLPLLHSPPDPQPLPQFPKEPQLPLGPLFPPQLPLLHPQPDPQSLPQSPTEPQLPLRPLPPPQPPLQPLLHSQSDSQPLTQSPKDAQFSLRPLFPPQLPLLHPQPYPQPLPQFLKEPQLPLRPLPPPQPPLQPLLHPQPDKKPLPEPPTHSNISLQPQQPLQSRPSLLPDPQQLQQLNSWRRFSQELPPPWTSPLIADQTPEQNQDEIQGLNRVHSQGPLFQETRNSLPSTLPDGVTDDPVFQQHLDLPLSLRLIYSPPIFKSPPFLSCLLHGDWVTAKRFFIGEGFVAAEVDERILFWSGVQKNPDDQLGRASLLPIDVVFMAEVDSLDLRWHRIQATGNIPPKTSFAAFAVLEKLIYLFGGSIGFRMLTNEIYSLSPFGEFKHLIPVGDVPSPRWGHSGWSFEGKLYFLGGLGPKGEGGDWVEYIAKPEMFFNNQLIQFDPENNCFSLFPTKGQPPSPRIFFAEARLKENVYIHGGMCNTFLNDFHFLNMKSQSWSSLAFGLPAAICQHTLSPISASQLVLVGGVTPSGPSKEIFVFDVEDSSFTKAQNLPSYFFGDDEGLFRHRAIVVTKEKRVTGLLCVGGFLDDNYNKHPKIIIKFEL